MLRTCLDGLTRIARPAGRAVMLGLILTMAAGNAKADTLWGTSADGRHLPVNDVFVLDIQKDRLVFSTQLGNQSSRPLAEIARLQVNNEPRLTEGEEALVNRQYDQAITAFERAIETTDRPWVKIWCALRIIRATAEANRFDSGSAAWIELVRLSPDLANSNIPPLPEPGSTYLNTIQAQLDRALRGGRLNPSQQALMLQLLIDVHRARNDSAGASQAAERLAALDPTATGQVIDPSMVGDLKLTAARAAITRGDFQKAIAEIESGSAAMLRPDQQAQALWLLAEARRLLARDRTASLDAAVAYLRVTAYFPASDSAGPALMRSARILEQLGINDEAEALYQQAAQEYPDTPRPRN